MAWGFCFFLALSQYLNVLGLNEIYIKYVAPTQYETLVGNHGNARPVAMIGNPNELGFLFVAFSLLCLVLLADKSKNGRKLMLSIFFAIYFFGVLLTLSRGSLVALVTGLLVFFSWSFLNSRVIVKTKILVALICIIVLGFLVLNHSLVYEKFTWRFMLLLNVSEDLSFSTRLVNWQENIDIIKQHPILGVGPLRRAAFVHPADNEWLLLWRSYGLIGVSLFIGLMTSNLFFKCAKEVKAFSLAITVSVFTYMIPTVAFHSLVLFPLLLVLLAIIDTKNKGFFVDYLH
jgi:O-antigen ligase